MNPQASRTVYIHIYTPEMVKQLLKTFPFTESTTIEDAWHQSNSNVRRQRTGPQKYDPIQRICYRHHRIVNFVTTRWHTQRPGRIRPRCKGKIWAPFIPACQFSIVFKFLDICVHIRTFGRRMILSSSEQVPLGQWSPIDFQKFPIGIFYFWRREVTRVYRDKFQSLQLAFNCRKRIGNTRPHPKQKLAWEILINSIIFYFSR